MQNGGSDDPSFAAFGLVFLRAPGITEADCQRAAGAILGTGGFIHFLRTAGGVTDAQLATLRQKLICNETAGAVDLREYARQSKNAVDAAREDSAIEFRSNAGGYLADMFIDAGAAAGIDPILIMAANEAAATVAGNNADWNAVSPSVKTNIDQAMSAFHLRLAGPIRPRFRQTLEPTGILVAKRSGGRFPRPWPPPG